MQKIFLSLISVITSAPFSTKKAIKIQCSCSLQNHTDALLIQVLTKKENVYRVEKIFRRALSFVRPDKKKKIFHQPANFCAAQLINDGNFLDTKTLTAISPGRFDQNLAFGIMSLPVFPDPLLISAPTTQYKNIPGKNLNKEKLVTLGRWPNVELFMRRTNLVWLI